MLRRHDQTTVACLVLVFLFCLVGGAWTLREPVKYTQAEPRTAAFQIDPNVASWPELVLLPGIGEKLADGIIHEREAEPFGTLDDLQRVKGIGPKKHQSIQPYVYLGGNR